MAFWTWGSIGALGMGAIWTWTQLTPMPAEIKDGIGVVGLILVVSCLVGWVREVVSQRKGLRTISKPVINPYLWLDGESIEFNLRHREGGYLPINDVSVPLDKSPDYAALELGIGLEINAIPVALIDRVDAEIMGQRCPTSWESHQVVGSQREWLKIDVPSNVNRGNHRVRVLAWVSGSEIATDEITLDFPART